MIESQEPSVVHVAGVSKYFGGPNGIKALDNVSFAVPDREFVSVLGPSGCGKSTLLRILAGLQPVDGGRAALFGDRISRPHDDVGVVFQTSNLLPWLSVTGNLRLALEVRKGKAAANRADIAAMVALLKLEGFERKYPHQLSGGMRHRVAIGQALMCEPRLLLLDEPFGALDALTRDRLNQELLRLWERDAKTVILITHSIAEAVLLSDRVIVLSERPGRMIADIRIDLPRPRLPSTTRALPAFADHVAALGRIMGADQA